jgi:hypothetical protein
VSKDSVMDKVLICLSTVWRVVLHGRETWVCVIEVKIYIEVILKLIYFYKYTN